MRTGAVVCFFVLTFVGTCIGLLFFMRPAVSTVEKRDLTEFPAYTNESFLDGSYFENIALWFADTYPAREPLVAADLMMTGLYGFNVGPTMVGGNIAADQLPTDLLNCEDSSEAAEQESQPKDLPVPEERVVQQALNNRIMDGLYVDNATVYNVYYFWLDGVKGYADALNTAAENLDGVANVYSVLAPNSSGALLDEDTLVALGGTDQRQALDFFYSLYSDKVTPVDCLDILRDHRDEYIYFRTDHHWTQLGAYYAYQKFCEIKGTEPVDYSDWEERSYDGFVGSYYAELNDPSLAANPDTLVAYVPTDTNDMTIYTNDGQEMPSNVISDPTLYGSKPSTSVFIAGDQPLEIIDNPNRDDGSSVLLVKDSYGCFFAPWLVNDYDKVYIIDFRSYEGNIVDYVKENSIGDVIFLDNMSIATDSTVSDLMMNRVQTP